MQTPMFAAWARNWWALVLRGLAAVLFGVLTLIAPGISLIALIALFAVYAFADGIFNIVGAIRGAKERERWGLLLVEGLVSVAVGAMALIWPGVTALALLYLIAAWAVVTGVLELAAAIRLRKEIKGEWLLALAGIASLAFGVLLMIYPGAGALAVLAWIAAYAIIFGGLMIGLGFRVRSFSHEVRPTLPRTTVPA
jgi:uncharacterized membrane protein HdeD (DUF308 family)